jgi:KH domain-containing protein
MKEIFCEKAIRILKSKKKLEKVLEIKINLQGRKILIEGAPENEYLAEQVIEALNFGFPFIEAIAIKKEELMFKIINIKEHTRRKDLKSIRARIIGRQGKTLQTLQELSDSFFQIKENQVAIIGKPEEMKNAIDALTHLIRGAKQANVYKGLEKNKQEPILDWGLKDKNNNL